MHVLGPLIAYMYVQMCWACHTHGGTCGLIFVNVNVITGSQQFLV